MRRRLALVFAQDPRTWSPADRVLLVASGIIPFGLVWAALEARVLTHPDVAPFLRPDVMIWALREQLVVYLAGWTAIALWALAVRRRPRQPPTLMYAAAVVYGLGFGIPSYLIGNFDNPVTGTAATCGITAGLLLIDRGPLMVGFYTLIGTVVVTTIAEQAGLIPYAPVLASAPFAGGHLSPWWLICVGGPALVAFALTVAVLYWVVNRWRAGEERLARTRTELARANDLVRCYVAPELAARIVDGTVPETTGVHERRKLTMVFCDLAGFARIADTLDDAVLARVLNDHLAAVVELAARFGGMVDKFVGDAALVLFGVEGGEARAAAVRAVEMAQTLHGRVAALAAPWRSAGVGHEIAVRVGINTGVATLGNFGSAGRMDYTVVGRQVNVAARLQQRCPPGRILVSHPTWALVRHAVASTPRGEISVKGIRAPLRVHEVACASGGAAPRPESAPPRAAPAPRSVLARWLGNPLEWSPPARLRLMGGVIAPFALYCLAFLAWFFAFPAVAPFVDRRGAIITFVALLGILAGTGVIVVRARSGTALVRSPLVFWNASFAVFSYLVGHVTNLFLTVVGIGAAAGELILFDSRLVTPGLVAFAAILAGTTIAEQAGLIAYAPLLARPPYAGGHLATIWLVATGLPTLITYAALFVLLVNAVDRWQDRERQLRETTARLDRATALIVRYVPAQLAASLLAGGAPAADGHERRTVTVCCTDIQDFAQTADDMESEDLARLLDTYLSEMTAIAEEHRGTIYKFVGDGVIILFGAPEARPEHEQAEAAVRMALAMQRRVRHLAESWLAEGVEHPFQVRIGVHTGPAVVGNFGSPARREYTVVGSAMAVAARLQSACEPGAVLVGPRTRALLDDTFEWAPRTTEDGAAFTVAG